MSEARKQTIYQIEENGAPTDVVLKFGNYRRGNMLAVSLYCRPDDAEDTGLDFCELYDVITVNLPESEHLPPDVQFIDVNNHPGIASWLVNNHIAEPYPAFAQSGFCFYPAFKFVVERDGQA